MSSSSSAGEEIMSEDELDRYVSEAAEDMARRKTSSRLVPNEENTNASSSVAPPPAATATVFPPAASAAASPREGSSPRHEELPGTVMHATGTTSPVTTGVAAPAAPSETERSSSTTASTTVSASAPNVLLAEISTEPINNTSLSPTPPPPPPGGRRSSTSTSASDPNGDPRPMSRLATATSWLRGAITGEPSSHGGGFQRRPDEDREGDEWLVHIPTVLLERTYEVPLQSRSLLCSNEVVLILVSYLPADASVLLQLGLVCRAWYERILYAPQWASMLRSQIMGARESHRSALRKPLAAKMIERRGKHERMRRNTINASASAGAFDDGVNSAPAFTVRQETSIVMIDSAAFAVPADGDGDDAAAATIKDQDSVSVMTSQAGTYVTRDDFVEVVLARKRLEKEERRFLRKLSVPHPFASTMAVVYWAAMYTFAFGCAYMMGAFQNGLDTDVKVGATYFLVFLVALCLMVGCFAACFSASAAASRARHSPGYLGATVLSVLGILVVPTIVGLLAIRLSTIAYLQTLPQYEANQCAVLPTDPATGFVTTTLPHGIRFEDGFRDWRWVGDDGSSGISSSLVRHAIPYNVSTGGGLSGSPSAITTVYYYVLLMERVIPNATTCNSTSIITSHNTSLPQPQQVAWLVVNDTAVTANGTTTRRLFTVADLPVDPIRAFSSQTVYMRTPFPVKYFDPYAPGTVDDARRWFASAAWAANRTMILPALGQGSLAESAASNPNFQSNKYAPANLRARFVAGLFALGGTECYFLLLIICQLFCPLLLLRRIFTAIAVILVVLVCNFIMMAAWGGACYFEDHDSCLMSRSSALALFVSGLVLGVCSCCGSLQNLNDD